MDKYKKKDSESQIDHLLRLSEIKMEEKPDDLEWNDIVKYCGFDCHYDSLRKALQPSEYGGYAIYKYLKDKFENRVVNSGDVLDEYEIKKQELYKQQVKFYDQRRELNDVLRKQSREDYLYTLIDDSIKNSNLEPFEYFRNDINQTDNDMLVFLTDTHYGLETDNYWNRYNPQIFVQYLKKYLDEIINIKQIHNSENCYIFLGGDLISGLIHNLIRIENAENVVEQVQHVSEYISNFVSELSKEFNNIHVHSVAGNHSRLMQNKKEAIKDEKLDLLIPWYLKSRLSNLENVFIVDNEIDTTIASFYIRGKLYYGVHGDYDSPDRVVSSLTQMLDVKPYAVLITHRHHYNIDSIHNVKVISSGSFSSVDEYCITKRISGKPSQTVCVCDKNGVRCSYDIILN
jgi:hypothetical protein